MMFSLHSHPITVMMDMIKHGSILQIWTLTPLLNLAMARQVTGGLHVFVCLLVVT